MIKDTHKKELSIKMNNDFIYFHARSGYRMLVDDLDAAPIFLNLNAPIIEYGQAILTTIDQSKFIPWDISRQLYSHTEQYYKDWVTNLMEKFNYKTKSALFSKMASCSVILDGNELVFQPTHHERGEAWTSTFRGEADYVRISADSPPEKIGEAMWQALRRCTGRRPDILDQE